MVNGDKFAFVEFYAPCEYKRYIVVYFRAVVVNILICFIAQSSINNSNEGINYVLSQKMSIAPKDQT